jgi:hypothetical protein
MAWIALDRIGILPYVLCGICSVVHGGVQYGTTVLDTGRYKRACLVAAESNQSSGFNGYRVLTNDRAYFRKRSLGYRRYAVEERKLFLTYCMFSDLSFRDNSHMIQRGII